MPIKLHIMRRFLALLLTLSIISCSSDSSTYKLEGNADGLADGTQIFVSKVLKNNQSEVIDTLIVKNNSFNGKYSKNNELSIHYIQVERRKGSVLFFPENTDLKATLFKDSIQSSFVTGSHQNDSYKMYSEKIRDYSSQKKKNIELFKVARLEQDNMLASDLQKENIALDNQEKEYKKQFIKENNNAIFSVLLLTEMLSRKDISPAEASVISSKFSPKITATQSSNNLQILINTMKKADVGGIAPNFTAPTPNGNMLSLNEVLGKYTIIDFWASWCRPCRRENPNVVKVYNKYHDKGLNIISVSLDKEGQKDRWIKAIADDKLNWHHVSNLKFWSDPIAKTYNVRSIPATFLLDENGNIIAKNLRGPALETKIKSLLGD